MARRRSWWGWGYQDAALSASEAAGLGDVFGPRFGLDGRRRQAPPVDALELAPPRLEAPGALRPWCRADVAARASHAYGKSYRDVVRALAGRIDHPPDVVARPATSPRWRRSSSGAARPAPPWSPTAGGRAWSAGSSPTWATATPGR